MDMVFRVYLRDRFMRDPTNDLTSNAMTIEQELYHAEINYQSIAIKEDTIPYIQILCNDEEEREHMKHILLKAKYVLCFEQDKKRYFTKWAKPEEKEEFKLKQKNLQETTEKERKDNEVLQHKIRKEMSTQDEVQAYK